MLPSFTVFAKAVSRPLSQPFKRSQLGLFDGKTKLYGNNVPHSMHKTRRTWLPNIQPKRFVSDALGRVIKLKVTTRALRSIKKAGGLDAYLLKTRHETLGFEGMRLRFMVRDALEVKRRELARAKNTERPALSEEDVLDRQLARPKPTIESIQRYRQRIVGQMREKGILKAGEDPRSLDQILDFISANEKQPETVAQL